MMYVLAPFIGWLVAGTMKFIVNYIRFGGEAKARIGNGGFPSNHTTIMTTTVALIGFKHGFLTPEFGLGVAITYIVIIDALGLRRHVGYHAEHLNQLTAKDTELSRKLKKLRESMGHTRIEVAGGLVLGALLGFVLDLLSSLLGW
ncbi:divergent PAP2 family protein [Paenibacillus turpanensis]|uniref:divergent PAP2 family protein n=1 Tax=Paenibacillus turpanensis TaxID=2689078 RepID=UPI00140C8BAD|nr:divergent PAP2 family protein [Paenibacillus turpanensis]